MIDVTGFLATSIGSCVVAPKAAALLAPPGSGNKVAIEVATPLEGLLQTFSIEFIDEGRQNFALKTANGFYVSAIYGGGIDAPAEYGPMVHTAGTPGDTDSLLTFSFDISALPPTVTIRAPDGTYLTAAEGGGISEFPGAPFATSRTEAGAWEHFSIIPAIGASGPGDDTVAGSEPFMIPLPGQAVPQPVPVDDEPSAPSTLFSRILRLLGRDR